MIARTLLLLLSGTLIAKRLPNDRATSVHDVHLSHTRVVIEGSAIVARMRLFRDDLARAVKHPVGDDSLSKRLVAEYINRNFGVRADGTVLSGELLETSADMEGEQQVWQVLVQWRGARAIREVGIRDVLLFDTFSDQQNIAVVMATPGERRRTLYFHAGDRAEQVVKF